MKPIRAFIPVLFVIPTLLASGRALAQCDDWRAGPLKNNLIDVNGTISAAIAFDPDGAGPLPLMLFVCGDFDVIGGVPANHVAAWDGQHWQAVSLGVNGPVHALGVYNGELVAGGHFQTLGSGLAANNVAHLQGGLSGNWQPFGIGVGNEAEGEWYADVDAFAVYGGELIAGGGFFWVGSQIVQGIAAWNGTTWHALGSGLWQYNPAGVLFYGCNVNALAIYGGDLYAGGGFSLANPQNVNDSIARWDGTTWHTLGSGIVGPPDPSFSNSPYGWPVNALNVFDGQLIVTGLIGSAGGVPVNNVAEWNGAAWHAMGSGISHPPTGNWPFEQPRSLAVFGSQLIAGGFFTSAGGSPASGLALWNGSQWTPYAGGLGSTSGVAGTPVASCLANYGGILEVGGQFDSAGGVSAQNLAQFDDPTWSALEPAGVPDVAAFSGINGRVVGAGTFAATDSNGSVARNIASWNGIDLTSFGDGLSAPAHALKSYTTGVITNLTYHLVAGGEFTSAGGIAAKHIAQWNENAISIIPPPAWTAMGPGLNNTVRSIERFGTLTIAGGEFTATGDNATTLNHIAQWNGTAWSQLGTGLNGTGFALKVYNGQLYAGGSFTTAGGLSSGGLARWNGTSWSVVGGNFVGTVRALEVFNNDLVIGGFYPGISGSPNIAKYNSTSGLYSTLGSGGTDSTVFSLLSEGGALYVGGFFTHAGGLSVNHFARWNGTAWGDVHGGADDIVHAMTAYHGEVHAGGIFTNVRNGVINSPGWARYSETGAPWIARQPIPFSLACNGSHSFTAYSATGYGGLNYQWRKDGAPLSDGPTGTGSYLAHTHAAVLDVGHVGAPDAGTYDCVISNGCGSATSLGAALTLTGGPGDGDGNGDGVTDGRDIVGFVMSLSSGIPQGRGICGYDMNADGVVNAADLPLFVASLLN